MKRMLKNVVLVGSVMAAGIAAADFGGDWCPIVGIDYKWSTSNHSHHGFDSGRGRRGNGASVYLGSRFCENFGLELGYDWSSRRSRTFSGTVTGIPATATTPAGTFNGTIATSSRNSQWRLDLNGYMPIGCCEGFDLIGSFGIASARTRLTFTESGTITPTARGAAVPVTGSGNFSGSRSRFAWRLGFGAQYMVSCNVGVRAMYRFESLAGHRHCSTFTNLGCRSGKNASAVTLGLFYQF